MKKIICMIMALCMVMSMVACSNQKEIDEKVPEVTQSTESKTETETQKPIDVVGTQDATQDATEDATEEATEAPSTESTTEPEETKDKEDKKPNPEKEKVDKETTEPTTKPTEPPAAEKPTAPPPTEPKEEPKKEETKPTTPPATQPTTPAPTEHKHSCTITIVDPTCKDSGYTIERCDCGYEDTYNFIPAYEHSFGDWTVVVEPTTSTNGQKMRVCSACNHQEFDAIEKLQACAEHTWTVTNKETVDKYPLRHYGYVTTACSVCGEKKGTEAKYFRPDDINCAAEASTIVAMVNSMRASAGLSQLTTNGDWNSWAATRAQEISIVYSHNRPNGASWGRNDGVNMAFGENIAKNCNSGADFYYGFLNSPQHSGLMKTPDATGIAVSIYVNEYGDSYCVMVIYGPIGF